MNELVATQLINTAREGKRVMVLSHNQRAARQAFTMVADRATDALRVVRANGAERIDYADGGTIDVRSVHGHGYRGVTAHLVFIEREVDHILDLDTYKSVLTMAAATGGRVIRE